MNSSSLSSSLLCHARALPLHMSKEATVAKAKAAEGMKSALMVHADSECEANMGYIVRPCLKQVKHKD